jgi:flap endonuclease-1
MGIQNLGKILREVASDGIEEIANFSEYVGKRLAIDANIYLHHFAYNKENKRKNSHIYGFFNIIYDLLKCGVTPVVILDGIPPDEKFETCLSRTLLKHGIKDLKDIADIKMVPNVDLASIDQDQLIVFLQELKTVEKPLIEITPEMYTDLEQLFAVAGIPYFTANGEADALCVKLYKEGLVDGILSEDLDMLAYGGLLITGIKDKRKNPLRYDIVKILKILNMTQEEFTDFCIMSGCDYCKNIKSIGCKTALKLVQKNKTIENILQELEGKNYDLGAFKEKYKSARNVFLKGPDKEDIKSIKNKLDLGVVNKEKLSSYLIEKCNYRKTTVDKMISTISPQFPNKFQ